MASLNIPNSFTNNTIADAVPMQQNFDEIESHVNANLVNIDGSVKAGTNAIADNAITKSKLNDGASGDIPLITVSTGDPSGGKNGDIWIKVVA